MKRLFHAIPIKTNDNGFIPLLDGLRRQLVHEKRINWVKPDNIHLMLKFIGNTPNEDVPKIIDGVGEMLKNHKSFLLWTLTERVSSAAAMLRVYFGWECRILHKNYMT